VIINNFHIFRAASCPSKTDPHLIVDSDAVLATSIASQGFQTVSRRNAQVSEHIGNLQLA
jgi:hypothetical protein